MIGLEIEILKKRAQKLRREVLDFSLETGIGHLGGCFSEIEILISLYYKILTLKDRFILSKGHACAPLYILLKEKGYAPNISGHPDIDVENGINCTTGSLGHGLPIGVGMALAKKKQNRKGNIYVLMGDGECQEGTIWESLDIAAYHELDNLTVIIDHNKLQALDRIEKISPMNLKEKFDAFGWYVSSVDGHCFSEIITALREEVKNKPSMILAHTIKGKGVSFMEDDPKWHGRKPTFERLKGAYKELE